MEGGSHTAQYTVVLNTQPSDDVMIQISLPANSPDNLELSSGGDIADMPNESITLTFTDADWNSAQTVTLTLADDDVVSGDVDVTIVHASSSSDPDYNSIPVYNLMVTTQDNEMPTVTIPTMATIDEGDSTEISVSISHEPAQNVEITWSDDSSEASISPDILTFTPGNWNIPKTAMITITDNAALTGDRTFNISYSATVLNSTNPYNGIAIPNTTITIIEDETLCAQPGAGTEDDFTPNMAGEDYGAGTQSDPYIICNASQLQAMKNGLDAFYELGQDIDASSITAEYTCPTGGTMDTCTGFQPIGNCGADGMCGDNPFTPEDESLDDIGFTGTLDGKGFTISGLTINMNLTSGNSATGLFGVTLGANIRNIGLLNVDISSSSSSSSDSSFSYFYYSAAGGLVGFNIGSIANSYSTGNISSSSYAGGLVGDNTDGSIANSYSTGNAFSSSSDSSWASSLVAYNFSGSITNSYSTGNVSSSTESGLAGDNFGGSITNSYYDQDTSGQTNATGSGLGTLTCLGGFSTVPLNPGDPSFTTSTSTDTGTCDDADPTIFFNWQTPFDIDNADMDDNPATGTDEFSVRYDSNNDGSVTNMDSFIWNFGTTSEYPFIASIPQTTDEQAVTMASGFLRFSNTTPGEPSATDFVFFYDIDDAATNITTSGTGVQGTTAGNYVIEDAVDAAGDALTGADLPTVNSSGLITLPALQNIRVLHPWQRRSISQASLPAYPTDRLSHK